MERKLSLKAMRMRQRFTFSRNQPRDRAATIPSIPSTPTSRPRSSTAPVSSEAEAEMAWDTSDASRQYHFTDEPGYFRPASPLLNRQDIDEDLEDDMKHACSLLIQSIDRGLPMWPSFDTGLISTRPRNSSLVQASRPGTNSSAVENHIPAQKDKPGCGVAFPFQSPLEARTGQNNFSGAAASAGGRFYGALTSPPPLDDGMGRGRSRGQSFATNVSTPRSRSRSRSSSPSLFAYSPPQLGTEWTQISDPPDHLLSNEDAFLGAEGMTWLRASLDIHRLGAEDFAADLPDHKPSVDPTPAALSSPAPRRFYSTRQPRSKKTSSSREWTTYDGNHSPTMDLYGSRSFHSLSLATEKQSRDFSFLVSADHEVHDSDSADDLENHETIYSVVTPTDDQPRHKRKRASHLLKRLAGFGIRRKETETVESRRIAETIQALG
ncbi:hypothetical protein N7492_000293 [Penicillium capsulatum]|uniref:Uncharacterized protein n=1 Tax=Penicillium capsulatum TaxID=69766 RepID=A0A9W9LZW3_9EURO|nr:hypothetical protein N7492_000293 [Penicillium capsulatum]KAJ6130642.1 hypothetical protein N7512_003422 [Penicillium capsulatum]